MDKISIKSRSKNMQNIRSRDTKPEITVRKMIFSMGYRYRIHYNKLPGKPDIVFPGKKKAIYVHGCFWHQHENVNCKIVHFPKSRLEYWLPKFQRTKERDISQQIEIKKMGWASLIIWECELDKLDLLKNKIMIFIKDCGIIESKV
tara:strand:+ start:541 stop:978 length:438 start_codon:yes stop_codon:yes gene_type:complete